MAPRAVIIGAGPGGLASAMLLAHRGFAVTVLEKQSFVGGRTSAFEDQGFRFDRGPTFFLYPRILQEIFALTGHDLMREVPMLRLDPQYRLVFGAGGHLDATPDADRMEAEIARLRPADAAGFRPFIAENRAKLARFQSILERPFDSLRDLLQADMWRALPYLRPWRTLHQEVGQYFQDPRLQLAFTFQGKYLGMSPFQCPSLFSILSFLEYEHGVFHPRGGCGTVSEAMMRIAQQLGADIRLGEGVESLQFSGRRVRSVRTRHGEYAADAVVINADFAHAMTQLVPDALRRRWTNRKLAKKRFSCSTYMLYLGLEGRQDELPHHTIYLSRSYEKNLKDIEQHRLPIDDPSFYVQNASVSDPTLAPPGCSTLYVLVPVPHQHADVDWQRLRGVYREQILHQLRKVGIEDVERRVRVEHSVTPADWENRYALYRGATFNLAHNLRQMLYWRPHNRFEDLEAVYLVGGGTHPGSGLPTIYSSARITAELLASDFRMPPPAVARPSSTPVAAPRQPVKIP